jgi:hypothetical protein
MYTPRSRRPTPFALVLFAALLAALPALAGCGKGTQSQNPSEAARSAGLLKHEAIPGAVSVVTTNTTRLGGAGAASDAAGVARAVFAGLTASTRPTAAVLVDARDWPAALAASSLASAPLGAAILFSEGATLPAASSLALRALNATGAPSLGGASVIAIGAAARAPAGTGAFDVSTTGANDPASAATTAVAIERVLARASGVAPRSVIVVDAEAPRALQMPAAGLAAESGAPILFIGATAVPRATASVLAHLRRPSIYLIGATVPAAARAALSQYGAVALVEPHARAHPTATARPSPAANAIAVARFVAGTFGWGVHEPGHGLVFANASRPLDAPAAAPLAAHGDYAPLLLLEDSGSVPALLARYLGNIQPGYSETTPPTRSSYNHGWLIGDESAISVRVQAELDTMLAVIPRSTASEEATLGTGE